MEKTLAESTAEFIADRISTELELGKQVLFLTTGGSGMDVCVKVSEILRQIPNQQNLTVMPTDERYGPVGHADSNWQQLMEKGFSLPQAKLIPIILIGDNVETTTQKFNKVLSEELSKDSYKIGLFGIGADGHTAGILPQTGAVDSTDLAYAYKTPARNATHSVAGGKKFERITMTPKAILKLDEAVVFAKGEEKWKTLGELEGDVDIHEQPAQILKQVKLLKIFTDYKKIK